ncbi:hypothetical protein FRC10_012258 [Ceratobasidium sp. 414]|nr:hypothetical protein FRC10_012258 [Ceratobasidium sp. 414]
MEYVAQAQRALVSMHGSAAVSDPFCTILELILSRSTFTFDTLSFFFFTSFDFNTKPPTAKHRLLDLALAAAETLVTWMIAYPSTFALGKVLLQTAPDRGMRDGRIEGFLRVMRSNATRKSCTFLHRDSGV